MSSHRLSIRHEIGAGSDYKDAYPHLVLISGTHNHGPAKTIFHLSTVDQTIELGNHTSVDRVLVENLDTSIAIELWFRQQIGSAVSLTCSFTAGPPAAITDDGGADFTATYGVTRGDYVTIADAATAGNNGTYFIQQVLNDGAVNDKLLFDEATGALTADAADALTLNFYKENRIIIPALEAVIIPAPLVAQDMKLRSFSGTPLAAVSYTAQ